MTRPVLVLGATGFLGSHVCEALSRRHRDGPAWVGVARRPPPTSRRAPDQTWYGVDLVAAPEAEYRRLLDCARPGAVINCVGATTGSDTDLQVANVHVVSRLLDAMDGDPSVRLVQLGSAAEYGLQPVGVPLTESADPHPASPYAITKLAATRMVAAAIAEERVDGTVLRVFTPVGARAPVTSLPGRAARAMRQAMSEGRPSITLGSLDVHRDFIAAEDVATAAILCATAPSLPPIVNIARGVAMSGGALITLLEDVAGFDGEVIESGDGSLRSSGVTWQQADITRMRRRLQWTPSTPIASALARLWAATA